MKLLRLVCRQEQGQLLNSDICELRALIEIEHEGHTGFLRIDKTYYKRDAETEYFSNVPGVTPEYIDGSEWRTTLDDKMWLMTPEATVPTPEITAIIEELSGDLG